VCGCRERIRMGIVIVVVDSLYDVPYKYDTGAIL